MLVEFPFKDVQEFWSAHQLRINGQILSEKEFFQYIWNADNKTEFNFVLAVLNSLESFFLKKEKSIVDFIDKNLDYSAQKGSPLAPKIALWSMQPLLKLIYRADDVGTIFLKKLHVFNERARPGTLQKLIRIKSFDKQNIADVLFSPDPTFKHALSCVDGELFFAKTLQKGIFRIGLTPFDEYQMLAECQDVAERLNGFASFEIKSNDIFMDGKLIGKMMWFTEFLKQHDINISKVIDCPSKRVAVFSEDYICPVRRRIIFHKDCAYGSPVYIYRMIFKSKQYNKSFLKMLFDDLLQGSKVENNKINNLHNEFIASLESPVTIKFNKSNEYIFINDKYLTSGKQALILLFILEEYKKTKRTVFEHKEFIKDERFISSIEQPGFVPRFERVAKLLRKTCPLIVINKSGRGKILLETHAPIDIQLISN